MGKLHTLRRAILRDPPRWYYYGRPAESARFDRRRGWRPSIARGPYRKFIAAALAEAAAAGPHGAAPPPQA